MKRFALCFSVFCAVITAVYSLKCYNCLEFGKESEKDTVCSRSKLEADEDKYLKDCSQDTCQRSHNTALDVHTVTMMCTTKALCEASKEACKEKGDDQCGVACCSTDKCNAGSSVASSFFVMLVCSVVGLALRKWSITEYGSH